MKNIEIATAHNIIFKYELATVLHRILAYMIDTAILSMYYIAMSIFFGWSTMLFYIFAFLGVALYHFIFEVFNRGQSIGKKVLKLRVVTLRGTTPTTKDLFVRWAFRMIDITFSVGLLAIINIVGSEKNQRIGDLIAQTSVVSLKSSSAISLKSLRELNRSEDVVNYPSLRQYSDEDMLLLKHAITRYHNHKTVENKAILTKIGKKILSDLDIKKEKLSINFLKELLNEYVIITR